MCIYGFWEESAINPKEEMQQISDANEYIGHEF